eukprot:10721952-Heterocapsa_arctica.AAC.1
MLLGKAKIAQGYLVTPNKSNIGVDKQNRVFCEFNGLEESPKQNMLPDKKWKHRKKSRTTIDR